MFNCDKKWNIKNYTTPLEKAIYECGWEEALKWVLGASQCSGDSEGMSNVFWDEVNKKYVPVGCDVRETINKELEDEQ